MTYSDVWVSWQRGDDPARFVGLPGRPGARTIRELWGPELLQGQGAFYRALVDDVLAASPPVLPVNVYAQGYQPERRGSAFVDPVTGELYRDLAAACDARPLWALVFVPDASADEVKQWKRAGHAEWSARGPLSMLARQARAGATVEAARLRQAASMAERAAIKAKGKNDVRRSGTG